ncbi:heparinase II/III family protein [Aurantibacter crassamenti]|uniref:heparinase II/III domain-containing protein n=1 Tax=Aurantibacter crassamenti TaxID=1837375 RepID=UPI00193A27E3|nr:heparinase II/III family protein [Aurantibacter crassamenti]MBM1107130.1 heparinase II/III family protein [Aurantibacter crassamenti]
MRSKKNIYLIIFVHLFLFCSIQNIAAQETDKQPIPKLDNPISVQYLQKKLKKNGPKLVLNSKIEKNLKKQLQTNPVVKNLFKAIQENAIEIQKEPLLIRKLEGRRLLHVSREMLYRMNILGMVYRMEKDSVILKRINDEIKAVCNFSDWNPSHYLDVAEMAMAVAFGIDWAGEALPVSTVKLAKSALIEKGIKPSYNEKGNTGWVGGNNNWNQVCHGGMIAASIVTADINPKLASQTISRALDSIPQALVSYGPDGVYPEGSTYWSYGTSFSVFTIAMLESAFNTDFGLSEFPSFMQSADFRLLSNAPSGWYYNFADCGDKRSEQGDITLAWFASKTGNKTYFEEERFLAPASEMGKLPRNAGAGLVWISQYKEKGDQKIPEAWKGDGDNPIVIFKSPESDPHQYYFGGKGGRGTVPHGNMDGGSFIFEVNGVRWSIDTGNQRYHDLEKTGFNLWDRCQECERWTLLTKNNFGHSTISVNNKHHVVDGKAIITDFKNGAQPEATIDLSAAFKGQLESANRRFVKDSPKSLLIEDTLVASDSTNLITWQMLTIADIEIVDGGAILHQDGKQLKLENLSHPELSVSVISLDPSPIKLDRQIEGLKRIEILLPAYTLKNKKTTLRVRLSGD